MKVSETLRAESVSNIRQTSAARRSRTVASTPQGGTDRLTYTPKQISQILISNRDLLAHLAGEIG